MPPGPAKQALGSCGALRYASTCTSNAIAGGACLKSRFDISIATTGGALMDRANPSTVVLRDLNKLNTFVRVAQCGSFTKAAVELRTRPSVISKRIKELEEALGFSVLNRSTHGLVVTEAGHGLFRQCRDMLARLDDYVTDRRNLEVGPFGTLRVQATSDYSRFILAPLASKFVREHPGVRIHLNVVPENFVSADDEADVILSRHKPSRPGLVA